MGDYLGIIGCLSAGAMVAFLTIYFAKSYRQVMETGGGPTRKFGESFPENTRFYQFLADWRLRANNNLIPKGFKKQIDSIWHLSGRSRRELLLFYSKLEIMLVVGLVSSILLALYARSLIIGMMTCVGVVLYVALQYSSLKESVKNRTSEIERELPYVLDLLSMMLYGGANYFIALKEITSSELKSPLTSEIALISESMEAGKSFEESLKEFGGRMKSEVVSGVVLSIEQGQRLGTPMYEILRTQAQAIRSKRILTAEERAQSAGVKVFIPATLIMLSVLLILLGPSIISMFSSGF